MAKGERSVAQRAMDLLRQDEQLDDTIFTPPAAIGLAVDLGGEDGLEGASVPRRPIDPSNLGSAALRAIEVTTDTDGSTTVWYQLPGRPALSGEEPTGGGIIIL